MSEVYASYEMEFKVMCQQIQNGITDLQFVVKDEQVKHIEDLISQSGECLTQLEMESGSIVIADKTEIKARTRKYKHELDSLKKEFLKVIETDRESKNKDNVLQESESNVKQLIKQSQRAEEQNYKLQECKRVAFETEQVAVNIQANLANHSDILNRNIDKNKVIQGDLAESNNRVSSIRAKMRENKLICLAVFSIVFTATMIIIYMKFY